MPTTRAAVAAIIICQPTEEKKRKEATASNNDERSGPQKKKYRYICSADGCSNIVVKGGVCCRHGAKVKRCCVDGCSNKVQQGGVCVRHGAKRTKKRCSFDGCTKSAQTGGVCVRHGAKVEYKRCSVDGCTKYEQKGGVCWRHGAKRKRKRCSVDGCPNQVKRRGVCRRHEYYLDGTPRANIQVQNNLGRDDGNTASATQISDDDAGGTQPQGIGRKGKAAEKQSNKLTSNNSVGERDEAVLFEKGPIAVTNREKHHQQSDDRSSDNEASEDEAPTYTFNGKRYSRYQDMVNAKRKRNQGVLDQSGLLKSSKRPPQLVANNKSNKRRKTSIPKKPTRQSKRLSGLNRPDYNEDAARTKSGDDIDRQEEEEEEESKARALEDEEQDPLNDEGRSQTENDCKGDAAAELTQHTTANGVEREVLSEQDEGQKTLAGSDKRPRINSSSDGDDDSKVGGGNDDEASGIVSGGEEQERSHQDSIDGNEVESPQCDGSFDGANQQDVFSPEKEDHEASEDERKSCVFGHHEGMAFSERGESGEAPKDGDIDLPEKVELHQGSALESEQMAFVSKEDAAELYKLQMKQMKERNSALEEAANALRSKLAEQVKTAANLQAQLDQVTGENRKLEEQMMQDSKAWDEERKRMKTEHVAELQEMTAKASAAESCVKSTSEGLARSAELLQAKCDEISQLKSEVEDMKGRHDDALAKEAAEKNRLQMELDSLRAQKEKESGSVAKGTQKTSSSSRYPLRHGRDSRMHLDGPASSRGYETRFQTQPSGGGTTATAETSPKQRLTSRSRNNKSNPRSSLETTGGASVVENVGGKKITRPQKGEELLRGLDKELVEKINNEIVDSGEEVTFDDIAGLDGVKAAVNELIIYPMKRPELYTGLRACPKGLLLFGPPGTGKTTIGKAVAYESGATFFSISSSSLMSEYQAISEKLVKTLFAVASYRAPSVVFIDEVDSLLSQRKTGEGGVSRRMKTEFLVQLDGAKNARQGQVLVIGATNLPHELDDAARRRFAERLYVPLPDKKCREALLRILLAENSHSLTDKEIAKLVCKTEGYSGSDIKVLCSKIARAPMRSMSEKEVISVNLEDLPPITYKHFRQSLHSTKPSVAQADLQVYIDWNNTYGSKVLKGDDNIESSDDESNSD